MGHSHRNCSLLILSINFQVSYLKKKKFIVYFKEKKSRWKQKKKRILIFARLDRKSGLLYPPCHWLELLKLSLKCLLAWNVGQLSSPMCLHCSYSRSRERISALTHKCLHHLPEEALKDQWLMATPSAACHQGAHTALMATSSGTSELQRLVRSPQLLVSLVALVLH